MIVIVRPNKDVDSYKEHGRNLSTVKLYTSWVAKESNTYNVELESRQMCILNHSSYLGIS